MRILLNRTCRNLRNRICAEANQMTFASVSAFDHSIDMFDRPYTLGKALARFGCIASVSHAWSFSCGTLQDVIKAVASLDRCGRDLLLSARKPQQEANSLWVVSGQRRINVPLLVASRYHIAKHMWLRLEHRYRSSYPGNDDMISVNLSGAWNCNGFVERCRFWRAFCGHVIRTRKWRMLPRST
jgi:hypothetical protein